jgi:hypothetical protein
MLTVFASLFYAMTFLPALLGILGTEGRTRCP